ncbi:MAG: zinc-binding dehydrogenase [Acidimicrobiales bacterium]|nr:zinc-binding dehydrogenase [Acidimicrobiales bacterium]
MRAFVLTGHGGMDKLQFHRDWPTPVPGSGEVLIRVHACGLNNTDVNTRIGWYSKAITKPTSDTAYGTEAEADPSWGGTPLAFPRIQGGDAVGTVVSAVEAGDQHLVGKRVLVETILRDWDDPTNLDRCGYLGSEADGGFAEYMTVHARNAHPIETELSDAELATFAIAYSTAENMMDRARVTAADSVLIPGASGGVGGALVQLAKRRGATVVALASESKHAAVSALGPDVLLPRSPDDLAEALQLATGSRTVSVVADVVGGEDFAARLDALQRGGRLVCSGAIAGPVVPFDLRTLYLGDLSVFGATILSPHIFPDLVSYIERREITPVLAATYPLEELRQAQQAFIDKEHVGNIVVTTA